jgi:hypothetical protein
MAPEQGRIPIDRTISQPRPPVIAALQLFRRRQMLMPAAAVA